VTAREEVTPALLLASLAWCAGTAGGSSARDLAIASALVAGARLAVGPWDAPARFVRAPRLTPPAVALLALVAWMIGVGLVHEAGLGDVLRLPWLVCLGVLAGLTAQRLTVAQSERVLSSLPALGAAIAVIALGRWVMVVGADPGTVVRAEAPLGYANALAAVLLATALLTVRAAQTRSGPLTTGLLAVQLIALAATGSRLVLLLGAASATWYALRGSQRWLRVLATGWGVLALAVLVVRFLTAPTERLHLWAGALRVIAANPVTGRGPSPALIDTGTVEVRPTTHAHDEVLQLAVEYGLVAVLLAGVALSLGWRASSRHRTGDRTLVLVVAVLAAPALTDFTLRVPAVALLLATVWGLVAGSAPRRAESVVVSRRTGAPSSAPDPLRAAMRGTRAGRRRRPRGVPARAAPRPPACDPAGGAAVPRPAGRR
jgi:hypothetical protein